MDWSAIEQQIFATHVNSASSQTSAVAPSRAESQALTLTPLAFRQVFTPSPRAAETPLPMEEKEGKIVPRSLFKTEASDLGTAPSVERQLRELRKKGPDNEAAEPPTKELSKQPKGRKVQNYRKKT